MNTVPSVAQLQQPVATDEPRFRALLDPADWAALPPPVRRRFSIKLEHAQTLVYVGEVAETRMSFAGRCFGWLGRLIGAPLPLEPGGRTAAAVMITEDETLGGQLWTRIYARPGKFAQVIHSAKRFTGSTGLEECVGAGVGMRLTLHVEHRALVFRSAGYFLALGSRRLPLPALLMPGRMEIVHREERGGHFSFTLTVTHPWFGAMIRQVAFFHDPPSLTAA
jgi:hypothetical protein